MSLCKVVAHDGTPRYQTANVLLFNLARAKIRIVVVEGRSIPYRMRSYTKRFEHRLAILKRSTRVRERVTTLTFLRLSLLD